MIIEKKLGIKGDYQYKAISSNNPLQRNWHKNKFKILENYFYNFSDLGDKKILDLGTGSGNFELLFHSKFNKIVGLDYNDEALSFLSTKLEDSNINNVELLEQNIIDLDTKVFKDKFDFVIMIDVIEHIKMDQAEKLISNLKKLLNDNGKIIIITPNYSSFWIYIEKILDMVTLVPKFEGEQHLSKYDTFNLKELFSKHNLKQIYGTTFNTFSYLFINYDLNNLLLKFEELLSSKHGNLLMSVFKKEDTPEERHNLWKNTYSNHLGNLYKNKFLKYIFDRGHIHASKFNKYNKVVLDFGCGNGYHYDFEKKYKFKRYIFADNNKETVKQLKNKYNPKDVLLNRSIKLDLQDNSVDYIILSHILEHVDDFESQLKEFNRILNKDGMLLVTAPCDPGFFWNTLSKYSPNRLKLKKIGLDYDEVMNSEHINKFLDIKNKLNKYFIPKNEIYYPLSFIKNHNFNLMMFGDYVKKNK